MQVAGKAIAGEEEDPPHSGTDATMHPPSSAAAALPPASKHASSSAALPKPGTDQSSRQALSAPSRLLSGSRRPQVSPSAASAGQATAACGAYLRPKGASVCGSLSRVVRSHVLQMFWCGTVWQSSEH